MRPLLAIILCIALRFCHSHSFSCLDEDGNPVEWFVGYKFPGGYKYAYILPGSKSWTMSDNEINSDGMLKKTYELMYDLKDTKNAVYGVYNDAKVEAKADNAVWYGHMKGAFAFKMPSAGFWIIHSIPKLSTTPGKYGYPNSGRVYGQHFMCVSLKGNVLEKVAYQLAIARPQFEDSFISSTLAKQHPDLDRLLNNEPVTKDLSNVQSFTSAGGDLEMIHFSKAVKYGKDLYAALVAPHLGLSLNVETWQHGRNEPSYCEGQGPKVYNIRALEFSDLDISFPNSDDHAKWAATIPKGREINSDKMWICLGDINRQPSQFHRGGGTMCLKNAAVWKAFNELIKEREEC
ncbi:unnamed protein product [Calicophoron daubneyi]|uniref:Uncharacterized protein n=1 Tax=Calicophoron daubneyi TaxID=300641 RepID=A0AAV2SYP9_CALDB